MPDRSHRLWTVQMFQELRQDLIDVNDDSGDDDKNR